MTGRDLDRRLATIERHLRGLDDDLAVISSAVRLGERMGDDEPDDPSANVEAIADRVWSCERCPSRLGIYDPVDDLLRIRWRDLLVHVHTGPSGFVRVVCRSCGHINEIHDEPLEPGSPPPPGDEG